MRENNLQEELLVFEQHKSEWLRSHPGDFVVVTAKTIVGFYPDYETAFQAGLKAVGLKINFLVKQILIEEPAYLIS